MNKQQVEQNEELVDVRNARELLGSSDDEAAEFLRVIRTRILSEDFPTTDCLLPTEVMEYEATGDISQERSDHVAACKFCTSLLEMSRKPLPLDEKTRETITKEPSSRRGLNISWAWVPVSILVIIALFTFVPRGRPLRQSKGHEFAEDQSAERNTVLPEITDGRFLLRNELHQANKVNIDVQLLNGKRVAPESYPEAAAGLATVTLGGRVKKYHISRRSYLHDHVKDALSNWSRRASGSALEGENSPLPRQELNRPTLKSKSEGLSVSGIDANKSPHDAVSCDELFGPIKPRGVELTRGQSPAHCYLSFKGDTISFDAKKETDATLRYIDMLRKHDGDLGAVDKEVGNIRIESANSKLQ